MARVVCECGQSFAPFLLNGVPRSSCPFCKRELSLGSDGTLAGTRPLPPTQPLATGLAAASERKTTPFEGSKSIGHSEQAARGYAFHEPSDERSTGPTSPRLPRFTNEKVLDSAFRRLSQFVATETSKHSYPLSCPQRRGCDALGCSNAFACGALPNLGSGRQYILTWTLGSAGAIVAFLAILFSIFALAMPPGARDRPVNYVGLGLGLSLFPTLAGALGFVYSSLASRWQQGHIRALATATHITGLSFLPLVRVPAPLADESFPVICPTPPKTDLFGDTPKAIVKLGGSGELDGREAYLVHFMFHFDPNDHAPLGGFLKVAQTIAKPGTAVSRPETWRMYVLVVFPEYLPRTPDFLISPVGRDFETHFVKRHFNTQLVYLPDRGHLRNYLLAMQEPSQLALLGSDLVDLLSRSPGWSIQVVGGRLFVWRGGFHPDLRYQLPRSGDKLIELLNFARQVRQILAKQALIGG